MTKRVAGIVTEKNKEGNKKKKQKKKRAQCEQGKDTIETQNKNTKSNDGY